MNGAGTSEAGLTLPRMATTYEQLRTAALDLPGAYEEPTWGVQTFRVGGKVFTIASAENGTASVKATREVQEGLIAAEPATYAVAPYVGRFGWVAVMLERADRDEVTDLVIEAWRRTAPRALVRAYDADAPRVETRAAPER